LVQLSGRGSRGALVLLAATAAALGCVSRAGASTPLSPGDIVLYRVGTGSETLSKSAATVWLDEYEPNGNLVESLELPTSASGSNKPLLASGGSSSEGLLTLSGNGAYLMMTGYDTTVGKEEVAETSAKTVPRTVGRVSGTGEINTSTFLENFANGNNPRSATSSEGTKIWLGGAGKTTTGGVHYTTLGAHEASTVNSQLNENDTDVRQVSVVDGQLYVSADPTKAGAVTIATVGSGLPTTAKQTITNLPFANAPEEPYAYSLLTLGSGTTPDTMYVAENTRQAIVKYGLSGGQWVEEGSVGVPYVTGVTANDVNGVVTIYAASSGKKGFAGSVYKFTDESGLGGTLTAVPQEIVEAPANEAFRGVAFAPGTTIGSGGTPPPAPTISTSEETLPGALGDPTNTTLGLSVGDAAYQPEELTVTVRSSNKTVAPQGGISVSGSGSARTLSVIPGAVGESQLTITVEAPDGASASTLVTYGASENLGDPSDRYYAGAGNCSTTIDVGDGYMICGDDEVNVLHLYHERGSGEPVKSFNFNGELPYGATEMDIEASARAGNTLYWMGSLSNSHHGEPRPATNVVFAATITGSGAGTELTYLGSYAHLREDLIEWDDANGGPLGFAASTEAGAPSDLASGFNIEGLEFASESISEAWLALRAPLEPVGEGPEDRSLALMVPVQNFSSLVTDGNPGSTKAIIGTPIEWKLNAGDGPLGIREIRRNAENEYLVIAGTATESDSSFGLYGWDGEPDVGPVALKTTPHLEQVAEGAWESIVSVPEPMASGDEVELVEDNGDTEWYANGLDSKNGLQAGLQKDLGRPFTVEVPTPEAPGTPHLSQGANPNTGEFTLRWKPSPTLHPTFTLQHQNARGGWTTIASGIRHREYAFTAGSPEAEGTWTYRVSERNRNESGESGYSAESESIKVDRTAPYTPTATASRAPDYAAGGGWYKDSVTVIFTANGDPVLADGSPGSGVNPATLTEPDTFDTSGSHVACGTVADNVGNVSKPGCLTVQVDATPPSVEISCPAKALVGEAGVTATVTASDAYSGLASDPSGTVPIDTSTAGTQTITRTAVSNVGLETTTSCTTEIVYPTPGAPALTVGTTPNKDGLFTLGWSGDNPLQYFGLSYTLQGHNAATETWSTVASGIEALSYEFSGAGEEEGTWAYRVQGSDPTLGQTTEYSPASAPVVVDETPPYPPSARASRAPDYAGGGGWYRDSVEVSFSKFADPNLSDGSPGSGINPASIPASETFSTSGSHTGCGTVADKAGNVSAPGCLTVQVDATPPSIEISCPASALVGEAGVTATVTASDAYSGLASDPSGTVPIDTNSAGPQTITRTAVSNVGLETTKSCTTEVVASPPEFGRCVKAPSEKVGRKTVYHGAFTAATCVKASKTHTGHYEWESGVLNARFTTSKLTKVTLETIKGAEVTCVGETSTGEYTGPKTVGGVILTLAGCELASSEAKCASATAAAGEIVTQPLEGVLGIDKLGTTPVRNEIGLDLYPARKAGPVVEFSCGSTTVSVQGSVIVPVTADKMLLTVNLKAKASEGKQRPENFVGGPKDILEESVDGAPFEPTGLTVAVTQENGERIEVNSVV
jgi:hypothetical protein